MFLFWDKNISMNISPRIVRMAAECCHFVCTTDPLQLSQNTELENNKIKTKIFHDENPQVPATWCKESLYWDCPSYHAYSVSKASSELCLDLSSVREGAEKKKKNKWWNFHHTGGGSLIFHHFPSFQQFFFLASKWPNSSRNAKKKISIFGDPPSYSASRQAFYVKILNIWLKNVWKKHLLQKLLKANIKLGKG